MSLDPYRSRRIRIAHEMRAEGKTDAEIMEYLSIRPATLASYLKEKPGDRRNEPKDDLLRGKGVPRNNPRRAEMVAEAQRLRKEEGLSYEQIADHLGVAKTTAMSYITDPTGRKAVGHTARSYRRKLNKITRKESEAMHNRMDIPISNKIVMRPVWRRRQRRVYGQNTLPPITEAEKADAIKILGDARLERDAPALWFDAFLILDEGGR